MKMWPDSTKVDGNDKEPGKKGNLHMLLYLKKEQLSCLKKKSHQNIVRAGFHIYLPSHILKIILQLLQHLKRHKVDMFMPKVEVHPYYPFTLHVL